MVLGYRVVLQILFNCYKLVSSDFVLPGQISPPLIALLMMYQGIWSVVHVYRVFIRYCVFPQDLVWQQACYT